jgi:hypothetical protein
MRGINRKNAYRILVTGDLMNGMFGRIEGEHAVRYEKTRGTAAKDVSAVVNVCVYVGNRE